MGLGKLLLLSGKPNSAPPPFNPLSNPGVKYFFNGFMADTFTTSGGEIQSWTDTSPNAYVASKITGGGPAYNGSYRNGKAAAIFSASVGLDFGTVPMINADESFHLFMLTNSANAAPNFERLLTLATSGLQGTDYGCVFIWATDPSYQNLSLGVTGSGLGIRGPNLPLDTDILLEVSWDGSFPFGIAGSMTMASNGVDEVIDGNPGIIPEPLRNVMGYNGDPGNSFAGPIGALYQCSQLSGQALTDTRNYFLNGWAL